MRRFIRLGIAVLVALGATATAVTVATPATAINGLERVYSYTGYDSSSGKEALAQCPAGTRVLGGGGYIIGGSGYVHFTRLQALGSSNRFAAGAAEHGYYADKWRVYAYAICGPALSGLVYVNASTTSDSSSYKSKQAECPSGKKMISAGARIYGGNGQVVLDDVMPSSTLEWQTTTAYEDATGYSGNWRLWAYGVCAYAPAGLELKNGTAYPTGDFVYADANCPAGKQALGLGGSINGGLGQLAYNGLFPSSQLDYATAYVTDLEPGSPPAGSWYVRAYAICAS